MKDKKIILVGGHNLGCACLRFLISRGYNIALCIARADDDGCDGVFPSLQKLSLELGTPVIKTGNINSPEVLSRVRQVGADIVLSVVNNMIFGKGWFEYFDSRLGIVNIHYAPLPRYAGFWPEMWAIWNGEKEFGVTLHYAAPKVDAGDIIAQRQVLIEDSETRHSLYLKNDAAGLKLIQDSLDICLAKRVNGAPQNPDSRSYCKREMPNNGFIDLSWPPEKIDRFIRALSFPPFTGAKVSVGGVVHTLLAEDIPFFKPVYVTYSKKS